MLSISEDSPTSATLSPTTGEKWQDLMGMKFNSMPWWITGVINDIPRKEPPSPPISDSPLGGPLAMKLDVEEKLRVMREIENGRAADLALKEILESIHEARYERQICSTK